MTEELNQKNCWFFPKDASHLKDIRANVESFMAHLPLDEKRKMRMVLCVDEAAANIIEHCQPKNNDQNFQFKMTASLANGFFKVVFSDQGLPFDPTKAPLVDIKTHIRSGNKGGLGVHIMRLNLDIFNYQRVNEKNIFTLGIAVSVASKIV